MKKAIICVVGPSGSGKTTAVEFASKALDVPIIRSYTTRQMRPGEVDGVDHIFVDDLAMPPSDKMLAYTFFGGHHYWATTEQVDNGDSEFILYVIDEAGLNALMSKFINKYDIFAIKVLRDDLTGIDKSRIERDSCREEISEESYDAIIRNNGTLEKFLYNFSLCVKDLMVEHDILYFMRNRK